MLSQASASAAGRRRCRPRSSCQAAAPRKGPAGRFAERRRPASAGHLSPRHDDGSKDLEILVLRHQLRVLRRKTGPPKLQAIDLSRQSLGAYLRGWLSESARPTVSANTLRGYEDALIHLAPIVDIPLNRLTA
jgi:hypothetical protein